MQIKTIIRSKAPMLALSVVLSVLISVVMPFGAMADSNSVNVWWPKVGAHVTGLQPFKAQVSGLDVSQYEMFWQVDNGTWNHMDNNSTSYPHKEASVDVSSWNWHGSGPYVVNFIAQQNGATVAQQSETIYIDNGQPITLPAQQVSVPQNTVTNAAPAVAPITLSVAAPVTISAAAVTVSSQLSNTFFVNPNSSASVAVNASQGSDQVALKMLASQPTASWFGNWNTDVYNDVKKVVTAAAAAGATPVLVAYNIPQRDCGGFSSGGSNNPAGYQSWIGSFASAIGSNKAVVILEPDALAQLSCLSQNDQTTRLSLLSGAVSALKANANTKVYIDAGHSNWIDVNTMSANLQKANVSRADGFSLNVSNFIPTSNEVTYGQQISNQVGGKHFVIDTSRNGGSVAAGAWCNPSGAGIGTKPTTQTGNSLVDAFLWVKTPGESDGNCNGGPNAGVWWTSYALSLIANGH